VNGPEEARGAPAIVFNAEAACRDSPSADCRLGLAGDPYAPYAPANVVGRVRHGDRLVADCFVTGARTVTAEDGRRSDRWYRVGKGADGGEAWLPAVRLAPDARPAVPRCGG
jgi:hypothetical protein